MELQLQHHFASSAALEAADGPHADNQAPVEMSASVSDRQSGHSPHVVIGDANRGVSLSPRDGGTATQHSRGYRSGGFRGEEKESDSNRTLRPSDAFLPGKLLPLRRKVPRSHAEPQDRPPAQGAAGMGYLRSDVTVPDDSIQGM